MCVSLASLLTLPGLRAAVAQSSSTPDARPENSEAALSFTPSLKVHIAPTTLPSSSTDADHDETTWSERGFDLKSLLALLYDTEVSRVELTGVTNASTRYDVTLLLPRAESEDAKVRRVEEALRERFHLSIEVQSRLQDVYVVTAPQGAGAGLKPGSQSGAAINTQSLVANTITGEGTPSNDEIASIVRQKRIVTGVSLSAITVTRGTVADLCRTLEDAVDRPVVDETHLTARYDFELTDFHTRQQLFDEMQTQLALTVEPAQRPLRYLVVRQVQGSGARPSDPSATAH